MIAIIARTNQPDKLVFQQVAKVNLMRAGRANLENDSHYVEKGKPLDAFESDDKWQNAFTGTDPPYCLKRSA